MKLAFRSEDREIWRLEFAAAEPIPGIEAASFSAHPDQRRQFEIADIKFLRARKSQAQAETAHAADLPHSSPRPDAVDLSQFAARPKCPVGIERQALRMVEPFRERLEPRQGDQRAH